MATCDENSSPLLSPLERAAVSTVLQETINSMKNIRWNLEKMSRYKPSDGFDFVFTQDELNMQLGTSMGNHDLFDTVKDLQKQMAYLKLQTDSLYVERTLGELREEICREGRFRRLIEENESISVRENSEKRAMEENERIERAIVSLEKTLAREKIENDEERKRLTEKFLRTQNETETSKVKANGELKYIADWEKARCEENSLRWKIDLDHLESTLKNHWNRQKNENRASTELMAFLIQNTAAMEEQIELWRERYEREKMEYEEKIRKARDEIETRQSILVELRDEFHSNQEFIDTYLAEKEALRKRKEEEENRRKRATRIQAWWRGVMVRRKLGPYRPEERKKKRAGKTKK